MKRSLQTVVWSGFVVLGVLALQRVRAQEDASAHANRGVALLEQFRFSDAIAEFEAYVALEPEDATGFVNLGIAYFNERDFDRAETALLRALELAPDDPYGHYNLGHVLKLRGETEAAVGSFERVAAVDPDDAMTHYYLGTLYAALGRLEDAERSLRRSLGLTPGNESAHFSLGNVLVRQGRRDEGRAELERFRELKEAFPGEASVGLQYTELGRYAEAVEVSGEPIQQSPADRTPSARVRFVEATESAGLALDPLDAPAALPESVERARYGLDWIRSRALPPLGTGISLRDLDGDDRAELFFVREGAPLVFRNAGGRFERLDGTGLPAVGDFVGIVVGDVDNDGDPDAYLSGAGPNALYLNDGEGRFTPSDDETVRGSDVSVSAALADVDHDGDLDLYVLNYLDPEASSAPETLSVPDELPGAPNRLYRNDGDGTFTDVSEETRTSGGSARSLGALFSDLDDDRDIDFVVVNDGAPALLFSNDRIGTFTESAAAFGLGPGSGTRGIDSADFDRSGRFDLFLTASGEAPNRLLRGTEAGAFRPDQLSPDLAEAGVPGARYGAAFVDADNDTDLDLLLVTNEADALAAYYESTPGGYVRAGSLQSTARGEGRALGLADVDSDGDVDAIVATDRGELVYFRNDGGSELGYVSVRARGLRSNLDGFGAKVEVKAGTARTRREVRSASGYFSQSDLPLHFGLGERESADYVRFLWPGGVKQIEMDVAGGAVASIEELNRKGTSCPILYAWDGESMRFVTDFLGGSAFGYLQAPGQYNYPDTDEVIKMEAFPLVPRDGRYEMRWVNQLEEVIIYDEAKLLVVDHPEHVDVFPNERLMPGPPYPEERLYPVADARAVVRATDHRGRDVTSLLAAQDRRYPDDFALLPFKGYAEEHSLTLDLGPLEAGASYVLLLYGWVDYADSSSNLAAAQAGATLVPPYLEVGDASGGFRPGLPQMGFPAGLPKTMLVDLDGLVGPENRIVRITTSMRLYWDQIRVAKRRDDVALTVTELAPAGAELRFTGYPAPYDPDGRKPALYTYDRILERELWGTHEGLYTSYGEVGPLLTSVDDQYVITHHGDELRLTFDESELPPLPEGWTRSFLARADGFGKDMDLNSARPHRVGPLPFHSMTSYPYPDTETFPGGALHERYNRRYVGRVSPFDRWTETATEQP